MLAPRPIYCLTFLILSVFANGQIKTSEFVKLESTHQGASRNILNLGVKGILAYTRSHIDFYNAELEKVSELDFTERGRMLAPRISGNTVYFIFSTRGQAKMISIDMNTYEKTELVFDHNPKHALGLGTLHDDKLILMTYRSADTEIHFINIKTMRRKSHLLNYKILGVSKKGTSVGTIRTFPEQNEVMIPVYECGKLRALRFDLEGNKKPELALVVPKCLHHLNIQPISQNEYMISGNFSEADTKKNSLLDQNGIFVVMVQQDKIASSQFIKASDVTKNDDLNHFISNQKWEEVKKHMARDGSYFKAKYAPMRKVTCHNIYKWNDLNVLVAEVKFHFSSEAYEGVTSGYNGHTYTHAIIVALDKNLEPEWNATFPMWHSEFSMGRRGYGTRLAINVSDPSKLQLAFAHDHEIRSASYTLEGSLLNVPSTRKTKALRKIDSSQKENWRLGEDSMHNDLIHWFNGNYLLFGTISGVYSINEKTQHDDPFFYFEKLTIR